ncbi:MAG: glucose-1-phosphate adenylyltransferase subunit GlgD [Saccharofermentanales bacterium]|jgi:glucose-1-phosphate adenylyltransferase
MLTNAMGLILTDNRRVKLAPLDEPRALAAVPFAGRFRIIDFTLSNMVNSGIRRVGIVALTRYKSLMDHIGTGAWWDLDRIRQGLYLIPPYVNPVTRTPDRTDAQGIIDYVEDGGQPYVIISSSDFVTNANYRPMIDEHAASGADMTVLYTRNDIVRSAHSVTLDVDENDMVRDVMIDYPHSPDAPNAIGLIVISRRLLLQILTEQLARGVGDVSIVGLLQYHQRLQIHAMEHTPLLLRIDDIASYFESSMKLLDDDVRRTLFSRERPIYTKAKNRAPCIVTSDNRIATNVLASDGCEIMGDVENSILFRGCVIGRNARVSNCVLFQDVQISDGVELDHVIIDKNSVVRVGGRLLGQAGFPIAIAKNSIV